MPAEARISSIWKKQKFFVAVFFLLFGAWFWYDGLVKYPFSNERWNAHQTIQSEGGDWPAYAKERGWSAQVPEKLFKNSDIVGQYVIGGLCNLLGTIMLIYWATQIRRRIRTDEEAVYTPSGTRVPFDSITGVGKKHWDAKGIAKVRYTLDGRHGQFIVDDYKFETDPTRQILDEIEQKLISRTPPSAV